MAITIKKRDRKGPIFEIQLCRVKGQKRKRKTEMRATELLKFFWQILNIKNELKIRAKGATKERTI